MTSLKQIEANRRNAERSTGPRTPEGRARACRNALKHGICTRETMISNEDEEALQELKEALWEQLQPQGAIEEYLAENVLDSMWRMARVRRMERALFDDPEGKALHERKREAVEQWLEDLLRHIEKERLAGKGLPSQSEALEFLERHLTGEEWDRVQAWMDQEEKRVLKGQPPEPGTEVPPPFTDNDYRPPDPGLQFVRDAKVSNGFGRLFRYEGAVQRNFHRCLHEFEREQAKRAGVEAPTPVSVEGNGSGVNGAHEA